MTLMSPQSSAGLSSSVKSALLIRRALLALWSGLDGWVTVKVLSRCLHYGWGKEDCPQRQC